MSEGATVPKELYDKVVQELDDARTALSEEMERADAAEARFREASHSRAFDKIAEEMGVRPEARDDAWKLLGFQAEGDQADEKALRSALAEFTKARPHFLGEGKGGPAAIPKGEGSSRGGRSPGFGDGDARHRVSRAQLRDDQWVAENQGLLQDGKFEIVD